MKTQNQKRDRVNVSDTPLPGGGWGQQMLSLWEWENVKDTLSRLCCEVLGGGGLLFLTADVLPNNSWLEVCFISNKSIT